MDTPPMNSDAVVIPLTTARCYHRRGNWRRKVVFVCGWGSRAAEPGCVYSPVAIKGELGEQELTGGVGNGPRTDCIILIAN